MPDVPSPATFRSLSSTLVRSIVMAGALCALTVAGLQLLLTYHSQRANFDEEVRSIMRLNVPLLSVNLWDIEPDAIRRQLKLISERPQIAYVRLEATTGHDFQAGTGAHATDARAIVVDVPYPGGKEGRLGALHVVPNTGHLYTLLAYDLLTVLAASALLTGLICWVVAVIVRRQLQRPMQHIADFAGSLSPEQLTRPLALERPRRRWRDEIDEVADGFRVLQEDLRRHVEELDSQVAQRTAELKRANDRLEAIAERDPLTGLENRRCFDREKMRAWHEMLAKRAPLSVLMIDIDYFKQFNDTYGHGAGDDCLSTVASLMAETFVYPGELPVRMGGEEFAVLLEGAPHAAALARAETLRGLISARAMPHEKSVHRCVTVSIGVSTVDVHALPASLSRSDPVSGVAELLGRADQALYEAKGAGRNTVVGLALATSEYGAGGDVALRVVDTQQKPAEA